MMLGPVLTKRLLAAISAACLALIGAPAAHAETRTDLVLSAGQSLAVAFDQPPGYVACPAPPVVVTSGPVSLGGATLALSLTRPPGAAYRCVLVDNQGAGSVTGTFAGLPEGTIFGPPHGRFLISYTGGDGNDVSLTRVEVPPTFDLSFNVTVYPDREFFDDRPITGSVYITGDTETSLAAAGTVTVAVDGAAIGTFGLVHATAGFPLGPVAVGNHTLTIAYSGATYDGHSVYLADTYTYPFTVRHRWDGPGAGSSASGTSTPSASPTAPAAPASPTSPTATPTTPTPTPTAVVPPAVPAQPTTAAIRAALRKVAQPVIADRSVAFSQAQPATGTVRWRVLRRGGGSGRVLASRSRAVVAGPLRVRFALGARAWKHVTSSPREHLLLETRFTTTTGRTITGYARLR
jgi:hypothetical protein